MAFDFGSWLHRRKVESRFAVGASGIQSVRITNPYHAVGVKPCLQACPSALALKGRRFLSAEAPKLPLADCASLACGCTYQHFEDRRAGDDRRRTQAGGMRIERRRSSGRRSGDQY